MPVNCRRQRQPRLISFSARAVRSGFPADTISRDAFRGWYHHPASHSSLLHILRSERCPHPCRNTPERSISLPFDSIQWLRLPSLPPYYNMTVSDCQAPRFQDFVPPPPEERTHVLSYSRHLKNSEICYFSRVKARRPGCVRFRQKRRVFVKNRAKTSMSFCRKRSDFSAFFLCTVHNYLKINI